MCVWEGPKLHAANKMSIQQRHDSVYGMSVVSWVSMVIGVSRMHLWCLDFMSRVPSSVSGVWGV